MRPTLSVLIAVNIYALSIVLQDIVKNAIKSMEEIKEIRAKHAIYADNYVKFDIFSS